MIRDAQEAFKDSSLFESWFQREQYHRDSQSHNQKRKRTSRKQRQPIQVKIGHGGTLDPMATGVLVLGIGSGTKSLKKFLECTKSYECVVLFGTATDSYDAVGAVVARKSYAHVTKTMVEEALATFRGKIMQRPPIFSALRVQGKKLYEYAREGKEVPVEIQERPVEVKSLELVEWMQGGQHKWRWPEEEAEPAAKSVAERVLHLEKKEAGEKRKRDEDDETGHPSEPSPSKRKRASQDEAGTAAHQQPTSPMGNPDHPPEQVHIPPCPAPAARLRMTVTSGFYVRSLCHDLGHAVGSLGLMSSLVRTRQADFELGKNVLPYEDLAKGEEVWAKNLEPMLKAWATNEQEDDVSAH